MTTVRHAWSRTSAALRDSRLSGRRADTHRGEADHGPGILRSMDAADLVAGSQRFLQFSYHPANHSINHKTPIHICSIFRSYFLFYIYVYFYIFQAYMRRVLNETKKMKICYFQKN